MGMIVDRFGGKLQPSEPAGLEGFLEDVQLAWVGVRYSTFRFTGVARNEDDSPVGVVFHGKRARDGELVEISRPLPIAFPATLQGYEKVVFKGELQRAMILAAMSGLTALPPKPKLKIADDGNPKKERNVKKK